MRLSLDFLCSRSPSGETLVFSGSFGSYICIKLSSLIERVAELLKMVFKKFFTVNLFMPWKDLKPP